jgi:hypothetical protein
LDWFDWLDSAVAALQENAGTVGLVGEGESVSAGAESGEFLDEVDFRETEEVGYGAYV